MGGENTMLKVGGKTMGGSDYFSSFVPVRWQQMDSGFGLKRATGT
jgi:hypothetical protein